MEDFDISKIKVLNNSNCTSSYIRELRRQPYPNIQQCSPDLLAEYATTDQLEKLNRKIKDKQDKLKAGDNIEIEGNTISAVEISYDDSEIKQNILDLQNNKQNNIDDLDIIREGASLGSTALQQFVETDPTVPAWAKEPNKPTYTAQEVGALSNSTLIPNTTSQLINDSGYITSKDTPVIDKVSDYSSLFYLDPNKMYMFGTRSNLNIMLNQGTQGIVNEYMFQFTSGNTATTLTVPASVTWLKTPNIQTNKKYAVSIENNLGIIGEWNNE